MPTTAKNRTKPSTPTDAIALLERDHRAVEALFKKYEESDDLEVKLDIAAQICMELSIHATIEEEIFYPGVKEAVENDMYNEAYVEHDGAKVLIAELLAGTPADDFYDAKVKVLSEMIKHHVNEEEQRDGIFAQAKRNGADLQKLGEELLVRKEALTSQFDRDGLPPPRTRSMKGAEIEKGRAAQAA